MEKIEWKSQDLTIDLIYNLYKSIMDTCEIKVDTAYFLDQSKQALEEIYKKQKLSCVDVVRPLTEKESFIFMGDYALAEYKSSVAKTLNGEETPFSCKNGTALVFIHELSGNLMTQFLTILTADAIATIGLDKGIPLIVHRDGGLYIGLFKSADTVTAQKIFGESIQTTSFQYNPKFFN